MSRKTNNSAATLGEVAANENEQTTTAQTPEQAIAPAEKASDEAPKVSKVVKSADKKKFLQPLLADGITAKDLFEALTKQFPQMTELTIKTLIVDLKNEKYSVFKDEQKVVKTEDGKIKFAEKKAA